MRIYLPGTTTLLRQLVDDDELRASEGKPLVAFAVTDGLREFYADDDDEESLEYAALSEAARASLRMLEADESALRRRVVLAADVDASWTLNRDDVDRGVIHLIHSLPLSSVASAHIDDADAEIAVAAAAAKMLAADIGDEQAQEAVDDAEGFELSWYATQEIAVLLELT
jgi:hypothetical protein